MKLQTIAKVALAGTALASLISVAMAAQPNGMPAGARQSHQAAPPQGIGPKKLQKNWLAAGNGNSAALPQFAFTPIDTTVVSCSVANCTIGVEAMVQLQPKGADWAMCLAVDGVYTTCQYQGHQGSTTGWVVGNARGMATGLAIGNHTVRTDIYVEGSGCIYAGYETDSRVYK